jgi:hypothetical protein
MADRTIKDPSGVEWDIIEAEAGARWTATPSASGDSGYLNVTGAPVNATQDGVRLVWPVQGEPSLSGNTRASPPEATIAKFANTNRNAFTLRVTAKAPNPDAETIPLAPKPAEVIPLAPPGNTISDGGALLALLAMAVLVYYADN